MGETLKWLFGYPNDRTVRPAAGLASAMFGIFLFAAATRFVLPENLLLHASSACLSHFLFSLFHSCDSHDDDQFGSAGIVCDLYHIARRHFRQETLFITPARGLVVHGPHPRLCHIDYGSVLGCSRFC